MLPAGANEVYPSFRDAPIVRPRADLADVERYAQGEFITGLDDDDSFHEQRIEKLLSAWRKYEQRGAKF